MAQPVVQPPPHRVALRPVCAADSVLLDRWRLEPSVRRHQPLSNASLAQLRADLAHQEITDLYLGRGDKFQWIILSGDQPAGWITLVVTNWTHGLAEIGYALSTPFQRLGIMPRALHALLSDIFSNTRLRRIEARCSTENIGSYRVLEKIGFRREGRLRSYFVLDERAIDNYLYAILCDDFAHHRLR
jgi:RimJ/RimL family protein N-acetyltransferase